ncbi:hypothetical protein HDU93_009591 [Gonapodya sp. JEL0774]|nr:hypothetical protein HDU93_009591 [Gonapodya sp. JEL0774]
MSTVLLIGASRGLGASLLSNYASRASTTVLATLREASPSTPASDNVRFVPAIDLSKRDAAPKLVDALKTMSVGRLDVVIVNAGYFAKEDFTSPNWDAQLAMYTISCIAPTFIVSHLVQAGMLSSGSKVVLVTSEGGSVTLRHPSEGGGNYAHHGSKAGENMVGRLLALDVEKLGISVVMVHPGFMRTEMTKNVGYDKYWDSGGGRYTVPERRFGRPTDLNFHLVNAAVHPSVAASHLVEFIDKHISMEISGQFWAPMGPL